MAAPSPNDERLKSLRKVVELRHAIRLAEVKRALKELPTLPNKTNRERIAYLVAKIPDLGPISSELLSESPNTPLYLLTWPELSEKAVQLLEAYQGRETNRVVALASAENFTWSKETLDALATLRDYTPETLAEGGAQRAKQLERFLQERVVVVPQAAQVREAPGEDFALRRRNLPVGNAQALLQFLNENGVPLGLADRETSDALEKDFSPQNVYQTVTLAVAPLQRVDPERAQRVAELAFKYYVQKVLFDMEGTLIYKGMRLRSLNALRVAFDEKLGR